MKAERIRYPFRFDIEIDKNKTIVHNQEELVETVLDHHLI